MEVKYKYNRDDSNLIDDYLSRSYLNMKLGDKAIFIYSKKDYAWIDEEISDKDRDDWYKWLDKEIGKGLLRIDRYNKEELSIFIELISQLRRSGFTFKFNAVDLLRANNMFSREDIEILTDGYVELYGNREVAKQLKGVSDGCCAYR
jgi:hypothetical protein